MTDDFTTEALQYLLEDIAPERRAAFETRLIRDPVAAAAFKTCADALADFALDGVAAEPLSAAERGAIKAAVRTATADSVPASVAALKPERSGWPAWIWPAAAAVLFTANLWQWLRPHPSGIPLAEAAGARVAAIASGPPSKPSDGSVSVETRSEETDQSGRAPSNSVGQSSSLEASRGETLRAEIAQLQSKRDAVAREYQKFLAGSVLAPATSGSSGKLVAMELVDGASYASGNRNGLVATARTILTAPGIVALEPLTPPTPSGPAIASVSIPESTTVTATGGNLSAELTESVTAVPATTSTQSTQALSSSGSLSAINLAMPLTGISATGENGVTTSSSLALIAQATGQTLAEVNSESIAVPTLPAPVSSIPSASATASSELSASAGTAYAWSVFDETDSQGYLNLYNLPPVAADQALELWVMPQNSNSFQLVGQVPVQFYGQSGSLVYKLAPDTLTPTQVLITVEPRGTTPVIPTGPTVLRGP